MVQFLHSDVCHKNLISGIDRSCGFPETRQACQSISQDCAKFPEQGDRRSGAALHVSKPGDEASHHYPMISHHVCA